MTSADRTPSSSNFERALGEELVAMATERAAAPAPAPRRSAVRRRPLSAALAVGAAAVTTAVVLPAALGGGHGGSAAYAVTEESDGTFLLELRDPAGLPDMVAELRGHGVRAAGLKHVQGTADDDCPVVPDRPSPAPDAIRSEPGDHPAERIDPSRIPAGATVLLRFWAYDGGQWIFNATVVDAVPACLPALRGTEVHQQTPVPVPPDAPPSGAPAGGATPVPAEPVPSGTGAGA
ncbi:hypothetical protein Kpho02_45420 [Kitasatospora phosalacinea]|uniref:Uncharacterized protein n=1 Tax=Kitasatospora phosalacinea TaxID=2065 RepID=A0A9W6V3I4_9ACTN|nr:hypothetical protein [Kitasatospora phosalacinea]GLW72243.1 hypothetical protein Kpho02_45420 [Kitasatospora phosalacinea]